MNVFDKYRFDVPLVYIHDLEKDVYESACNLRTLCLSAR